MKEAGQISVFGARKTRELPALEIDPHQSNADEHCRLIRVEKQRKCNKINDA